MYLIEGRIKGVSPILFNKLTQRSKKGLKSGSSGMKISEQEKIDECREKVHSNEHGIVIPREMFKSAIVEGCKKAELKKGKKALWPYLEGAMQIEEPLILGKKTFDQVYETDIIKKDGTMVHSICPQINEWSPTFKLLIASDLISSEDIRIAIEYAGLFNGLGSNRRHGYGKFILESFKRHENGKTNA